MLNLYKHKQIVRAFQEGASAPRKSFDSSAHFFGIVCGNWRDFFFSSSEDPVVTENELLHVQSYAGFKAEMLSDMIR